MIGLLLGAAVAVLWTAPGAYAHAALVASDPREGSTLDALPSAVSFEFSEEMSAPAYVVVTGPDGSSVASGDPQVRGAIVTQELDGSNAPGSYTMAYRAVSADGHPVTGQITFSVGEPAASGTPSDAASASASDAASPSASPSASAPAVSPSSGAAAAGPADTEGFWERRGLQIGGAAALLVAASGAWLLSRRAP